MMMMMADNNPKYSWDIPSIEDDDDDRYRRRLEIINRLFISEDPRFYGSFKVINRETKDVVFRAEKSPYSSLVKLTTSIDENDNSPRPVPSSVWIDIDRMMLDCLIWVNPWFLAIDGKPVHKIEYKNKSVEIYQTQKTYPDCTWGPSIIHENGTCFYDIDGAPRTEEEFSRHYLVVHLEDFIKPTKEEAKSIVNGIRYLGAPILQLDEYPQIIDWVLKDMFQKRYIKINDPYRGYK